MLDFQLEFKGKLKSEKLAGKRRKMKNSKLKTLALLSAAILTAGVLVACGSQATESTVQVEAKEEVVPAEENNTAAPAAPVAEVSNLSGNISLSGSTSMEKLANAIAESFMAKYPDRKSTRLNSSH